MAPLTRKQIAALMDIKPASRGHRPIILANSIKEMAFGAARNVHGQYQELWQAYYDVGVAAQLVAWTIATGRVQNPVTLDFREMRPWQVICVIESVAAVDMNGLHEREKLQHVENAITIIMSTK